MTKWKTVTINLTQEQSRQLKALAGLNGMSQSAFLKYLLDAEVRLHRDLAPLMNSMDRKEVIELPELP
jgi:hypothetical protein